MTLQKNRYLDQISRIKKVKMIVCEGELFDENREPESCNSIPVLLFNNAKFYLLNSG